MMGIVAPQGTSPEPAQSFAASLPQDAPEPPSSFGEVFKAGVANNISTKIGQYAAAKYLASRDDSATLTPQQAQQQYGVSTKEPIPESMAEYAQTRRLAEEKYDNVTRNVGTVKKFTAGLASSLADPLQDATMLIPGLGEGAIAATAAETLGINTASVLGKAAVRAGAYGSAAVAGQVPLTALNYGLNNAAHQDYTAADAMHELMTAAALGAAIGPFAGAIHAHFAGEPAWSDSLKTNYPETKATAETALAQFKNEQPVDVRPLLPDKDSPTPEVKNQALTDMVNKQAQFTKEGSAFGIHQDTLRATTEAADEISRQPELEPDQELRQAKQSADDLEQTMRETHAGNAELQEDFDKVDAIKEDEKLTDKIYNIIPKCLGGVGYV